MSLKITLIISIAVSPCCSPDAALRSTHLSLPSCPAPGQCKQETRGTLQQQHAELGWHVGMSCVCQTDQKDNILHLALKGVEKSFFIFFVWGRKLEIITSE